MIVHDKITPTSLKGPRALSIGMFDGVHLGHQYLIDQARKQVGDEGSIALLTFKDHPSALLNPANPIKLIYTQTLKTKALKEVGVDLVFLLEFTQDIAQLSYQQFLKQLKKAYPFDVLIQGSDTAFGKNRAGTKDKVKALSKEMNFEAIYLDKIQSPTGPISSRQIRYGLSEGNIASISHLLGRPYVLEGDYQNKVAFHPSLCLPKEGTYPAQVKTNNSPIPCQLTIEKREGTLAFEPAFDSSQVKKGPIFIELEHA